MAMKKKLEMMKMKKVKLIKIHSEDNYGYLDSFSDHIISSLIPESEYMEVSDEEYEMLCDYRVRSQILNVRNKNSYDRLILLEDRTSDVTDLIESAKDILAKVKKQEEENKKRAAAEKAKKDKLAKEKAAKKEAKKIEEAEKILRAAGKL